MATTVAILTTLTNVINGTNQTSNGTPNSTTPAPYELPEVNSTFVALKAAALGCLVVWTIIANALVFVVLYKNPRLQTVPNFLVGNLAFSDLCLGLVVLPLSAVYAVTLRWSFGEIVCEIWLSSDVLCSTASIWNLSIIGLDRYWAITSPITYMTKRNMRSAVIMIAGVWALSMLISVAPFLGWRSAANTSYYVNVDNTDIYQCQFMESKSYSIYSATGSFFIPLMVMFFVYFQIYRAFAEHKARQIYRQKVIKKHIESTILHEISHVLPTSDEFAKEKDGEDDEEDEDSDEEDESESESEDDSDNDLAEQEGEDDTEDKHPDEDHSKKGISEKLPLRYGDGSRPGDKGSVRQSEGDRKTSRQASRNSNRRAPSAANHNHRGPPAPGGRSVRAQQQTARSRNAHPPSANSRQLTYERVRRHKQRKERRAMMRQSLQRKPPAISAAKEKRGVKVLGIILGCFTICWFPFFIMYLITGFCTGCRPNAHVEQFITWLGYSNSAMNPIIYTVFNRDYQTALKKLFTRGGSNKRRHGVITGAGIGNVPGRLSKL